jgi:hypothetical protein
VIASENGGFMKQGELKVWRNSDNKEIVILVTNKDNTGVVVHSDNLVSIGTVVELDSMNLSAFIGNVNMVSEANK